MTLTTERRGEIAIVLLKQYLFDKGITLRPREAKRELGNLAQKTGLPKEEISSFLHEIAEEALETTFGHS